MSDTCITTPISTSKSPAPPQNFQTKRKGTAYLELEEVEPPHGVKVQGNNGASSQRCGRQQELREVVCEVTKHHVVTMGLAGEQVDNACTARQLGLINSIYLTC
jgi:hypothetical protein